MRIWKSIVTESLFRWWCQRERAHAPTAECVCFCCHRQPRRKLVIPVRACVRAKTRLNIRERQWIISLSASANLTKNHARPHARTPASVVRRMFCHPMVSPAIGRGHGHVPVRGPGAGVRCQLGAGATGSAGGSVRCFVGMSATLCRI